MNGLRMVRIRCNFSEMELATILGVTRQAVSMWENGKKKIPEERLMQLSDFFGLDKKYFGEISEKEKEELLNLPMFICTIDGREKYKYKITGDSVVERADYLYDIDESFDSMYEKACRRKQEVLTKVENIMDGPKTLHAYEKSSYLYSECEMIDLILRFKDIYDSQRSFIKVSIKLDFLAMVYAELLAHDNVNESEFEDFFKEYHFEETDRDYYYQLALSLREHWKEKMKLYDADDISLKKTLRKSNIVLSNDKFMEYLNTISFDDAEFKGFSTYMKSIYNRFEE